MYSPYDFNQSIAHRAEYVEERLKAGSPVVGLSFDGGVLLFTVRRAQRKIFEIYDQLMYSAIGNHSDVEAVRLAAIDFAHQEGFARSPDDVSIQRLVGFAISPAIKRAFSDPMTTPSVLRAIFAEVGKTPAQDSFFVLNYDGEFSSCGGFAAIAGSTAAEDAMRQELEETQNASEGTPDLTTALQRAARAWQRASTHDVQHAEEMAEEATSDKKSSALLELQGGTVEAAILQRDTPRESKFRLLCDEEMELAQLV